MLFRLKRKFLRNAKIENNNERTFGKYSKIIRARHSRWGNIFPLGAYA
jgi:hypothetical protein